MCQIETIKSLKKVSSIKAALEDMPETLFDSYERDLLSIEKGSVTDARSIMQWIAFAKRPLTLEEVAEAATAMPDAQEIDGDDKLYDPYDVLRICKSLLSLSEETIQICQIWQHRQTVRFAHASVREYLLSDHLARGPASVFSLSPQASQVHMGRCCVSVLLRNQTRYEGLFDPLTMPLVQYSAQFWCQHAEETNFKQGRAREPENIKFEQLIKLLLNSSVTIFRNWLTIYDPDRGKGSNRLRGATPSPLYYSALMNLVGPAEDLLDRGYEIDFHDGGRYGPPLAAAAAKGKYEMVELLLSRGANPNIMGGPIFGSPLQAACFSGSIAIVQELIKNGAIINNSNEWGKYETPLEIACEYGYRDIVGLLLTHGADVNARSGGRRGGHGSALHAAASKGFFEVSALLLHEGAEVNLEGGHFGSALQAAVAADSESLAKLLLDKGADPNLQSGGFRDALRAAAWRRNLSIFVLLLERGADVDLSMAKLRELASTTRRKEDVELVQLIKESKVHYDESLLELVRRGAQRISAIESEQYLAERLAWQRRLKFDSSMLRKIVQHHVQQDLERYRSSEFPATWLTTFRSQTLQSKDTHQGPTISKSGRRQNSDGVRTKSNS